MTPAVRPAGLAAAVTGLVEPARLGPRVVDVDKPHPFALDIRNDVFAADGSLHKWQEFAARVDRTVAGGVEPPLVPVRYTWRSVRSRAGAAGVDASSQEWTFARGQGFTSALLDSEVRGGPAPARVALSPTSLGVAYPDLPRTPAVDALVSLSWDVLLFEILCTELTTHPDLPRTGTTAQLTRLSEGLTRLELAGGRSGLAFQHHQFTASRQGYGMFGGRPAATFAFECLDCDVSSQTGRLRQRARSTYLGSLQVDLDTGDLIGAHMVEMMVGVATSADRTTPVRVRRVLRLAVPVRREDIGTDPASDPAPVRAAGDGPLGDAAVVAAAHRLADRLQEHQVWLAGLPDGLRSLVELTFRSIVGTDLGAAGAGLPRLDRQDLARLETYCRLGREMAGKVSRLAGVAAADTLTAQLAAVRLDVAELTAMLARVDRPVEATAWVSPL